jgi:hypothetical protein
MVAQELLLITKIPVMKKCTLLSLLLILAIITDAQGFNDPRVVDSTVILNRLTGPVTRGTLIKTSTVNFYEINDKIDSLLPEIQPEVVVYEDGENYRMKIRGIDSLLHCTKLREVIESNIDGDFKGWDGTTTFKLANMQEWQPAFYTPNTSVTLYKPTVFIYLTPAGYKMKIEGLNEEPIFVKKLR